MLYPLYNQELSNSECFGEENLLQYLNLLHQEYSVTINFHDLVGISKISDKMHEILAPYLYHNNPFCNYLKKFNNTTDACAINKDLLCHRLRKHGRAFYGACYMGVEELRYPVLWNGKFIACLCIGQFCSNEEKADERLLQKADRYQLSYEELSELFHRCTCPLELDITRFTAQIGILTQYISATYDSFIKSLANGSSINTCAEQHKQNYITSCTIEYIDEHLSEILSLDVLASICYCSKPYLSAVFKKNIGQTLTDYICSKRIGRSRELLDLTTMSVSEIAYACGYSDPSYFTRVFRQLEGISPTKYRNRK